MTLIYGILVACNDLDLRVHHRSQMQAAGLHRILELLCDLGHPPLDELLTILRQTLNKDEKRLRERLDQEFLKDFRSLEEVFDAIRVKMEEREIQRRVNEMDKVNPSTFLPSRPKSNANRSAWRTTPCRTTIDSSCSMSFAKHAADTV